MDSGGNKHWLLTKFIHKVMEHNGDRITSEERSALSKKIFDLHLHRLSPAGSNDAEQLLDSVEAIQSWSHESPDRIRREFVLPYYESLLTLANQSARAKLDTSISAVVLLQLCNFLFKVHRSRSCQTLDDILDQLRFHVDRMRREPVEASICADFTSRVFLAILRGEAEPISKGAECASPRGGANTVRGALRIASHALMIRVS